MSSEQKKGQKKGSKLEEVTKDLEQSTLKDNEKGQIEGGFASASLKDDIAEPGTNVWCNENC